MAPGYGVTGPGALDGTGFTDFVFQNPVAVTPGTTYFLSVEALHPSSNWGYRKFSSGTEYTAGTEYRGGNPGSGDLWFREGIIIPEPSSAALLLFGSATLFFTRRHRRQTPE